MPRTKQRVLTLLKLLTLLLFKEFTESKHLVFLFLFLQFSLLGVCMSLYNMQVLRARHGMLTLHEHLVPPLFCKGVRGFQAFVPFIFVLSFSLFQIYLVSLNNALLISHMRFLYWTYNIFGVFCIGLV